MGTRAEIKGGRMKMNPIYMTIALLKVFILKLFPSMGYQGVVNKQIQIYKQWSEVMPEQEVLNRLILSRIHVSWGEKEEASRFYDYLLKDTNKTLKDVIRAIVNYEYFESLDSKRKIASLPEYTFGTNKEQELNRMKNEYLEYINKSLREIKAN